LYSMLMTLLSWLVEILETFSLASNLKINWS
jgi:hypothetical protein